MINLNGTTTGYGANTAELANADIRIGNGAAPSNGIYSPGANQLAISTAGTGRLFVDASGKVGIGTSSPGATLHVEGSEIRVKNGTGVPNITLAGRNTDDTAILAFQNNGSTANNATLTATTNTLAIATGGTERLRITSTGNVGIGTSAPGTVLHCAINSSSTSIATAPGTAFFQNLNATSGAINNLLFVNSGGFGSAAIYTTQTQTGNSGDNLVFTTKTSGGSWNTGVVIDTFGRLLVGTSAALNVFNYRQQGGNLGSLQAVTVGAGANTPTLANFAAATYAQQLSFVKSRGTAINDYTIVADGDNLGSIYFFGADGQDVSTAGSAIISQVDGTPGADDMPGRLVFSTTADGAATPTERMVIKADGKVGIGTTTPSALLHVASNLAGNNQILLTNIASSNSGAGSEIVFTQGASGFAAGKIQCDREGSYTTTASTQNSALAFFTAATGVDAERVRIDSSGKVGIGTSSPGSTLHLLGAPAELRVESTTPSDGFIRFTNTSGSMSVGMSGAPQNIFLLSDRTNAHIAYQYVGGASGAHIWFTNNAERARLDSSGRLLVGTSAARNSLFNVVNTYGGLFQVEGTGQFGGTRGAAVITNNSSIAGAFPYLVLAKANGDSIGSTTIVSNGNTVGMLSFQGSDGSEFVEAANITAEVDGTPGANDMPGRLLFATTADGASSPTERVRITSDGKVGIGTSSPRSSLDVTGTTDITWTVGVDAIKGLLTVGTQGTAGGSLFVHTPSLNATYGAGFAVNGSYSNPGGIGTAVINLKALGVCSNGGYDSALAFHTSSNTTSAERLRITGDGRVGIGTSSPGAALDVTTSGNGRFQVQPAGGIVNYKTRNTDDTGYGSAIHNATQHIFQNASNEVARIDSSGRLLVGTSTARAAAGVQASMQVETTNYVGASIVNNSGDTGGAALVIGKTRSTSIGGVTIVQNNDNLGDIYFVGADGVNLTSTAARITAAVDGTPGANDMPGRLVFSTTADGASSPTEAMRINNQRELLIGTTTRTANGGVLQISNGITFPGTQSACSDPNTLDDYEEGTWTPVLRGSGTAGTYELSRAIGIYTKVGRQVTLTMAIQLAGTITGGGTGYAQITGLPFQQAANSFPGAACATLGVDYSTNYTNVFFAPITAASTSTWFLQEISDNVISNDLPIAAFSAADEVLVTVSFIV